MADLAGSQPKPADGADSRRGSSRKPGASSWSARRIRRHEAGEYYLVPLARALGRAPERYLAAGPRMVVLVPSCR